MYIRDAQGRLRWLPPQDFTDQVAVAAATRQQQHHHQPQNQVQQQQYQSMSMILRQQHIQEEWMKFNAPPPQQSMQYEYDYDYDVQELSPPVPPPPPPRIAMVPHHHQQQQQQQHGHQQPLQQPSYFNNNNSYHGSAPYRHQPQQHHQVQYNNLHHYRHQPPIPQVVQPTILSPRESIGFSPSLGSSIMKLQNNDDATKSSRNRNAVIGYDEYDDDEYDDDDDDRHLLGNVNCMNTLFGGSAMTPKKKSEKKTSGNKMGLSCNQIDSTTTEVEFNIKLPDHYMTFMAANHNNNNLGAARGHQHHPHHPMTGIMKDYHERSASSGAVGDDGPVNATKSAKKKLRAVDEDAVDKDGESGNNGTGVKSNKNPMAAFQCHGGGSGGGLSTVNDDTIKTKVMMDSTLPPAGVGQKNAGGNMNMFQCTGVRGPPKSFDYSRPGAAAYGGRFFRNGTPPGLDDEMSLHASFDEKSYVLDANMFAIPPPHPKIDRRSHAPNSSKKKKNKPSSSASSVSDGSSADERIASRQRSSVKKVAHRKKVNRHRQQKQVEDSMKHIGNTIAIPSGSPTPEEKSVQDSKNQAILSQSVAEICRQRMAELMMEEHPSFDGPKKKTQSLNEKTGSISGGSASSTTNMSTSNPPTAISTTITKEIGEVSSSSSSSPPKIVTASSSSSSSDDESFSSAVDGENTPHMANMNPESLSKSSTTVKTGFIAPSSKISAPLNTDMLQKPTMRPVAVRRRMGLTSEFCDATMNNMNSNGNNRSATNKVLNVTKTVAAAPARSDTPFDECYEDVDDDDEQWHEIEEVVSC